MNALFKNKQFSCLLFSELFTVLSFSMYMITVSWYVVDVLHHPQYLGLVMAAASIPRMITMIIGGVLADRIQKSKILFSTQLLKGVLLGILLWSVMDDSLTLALLLIVSFFIGCLDGFFFPALSSLIPSIVSPKQLQPANTLIHSSQELLYLIGPVAAGAILHYYNFSATFAVSIIATLIGACFVFPAFIKDAKPDKHKEKTSFITEFKEGYRYLRSSSIYISAISIIIIVNFFVFGPMFLSLPILAEELGGSALDLSFLEAGFSIGSLTATIFLLFFTLKKNRGRLILIFLIASVLALGVFSQIPSLHWLIPVAAMIGFFGFITYIPTDVIIQEKTDPAMMGRVMSIVFLASTAFDPISQTLFSSLMSVGFSARILLAAFAGTGLLMAALVFAKAKKWRNMQ
ncbi:MFS transporter [Terribacillus saccharophilus]|uniref:Major Facilitator Superfamily protein n=1 Tax=Terribacillus saccharophilus TaxID=361277 RepID=A0AAX2EHJ9_9BACI|nr:MULTISPECIES: MFS transporter [Terribacillus]MCM3225870.1 MFS transporter [Terribacillus saccharophilus]MEC0281427.1 MFS transporter [Terribacillus saccharophilus]MEC0291787.1 MFS transporter [Terribacillus saccharophilus]SEN55805.1 Major Facilitator Superfamily protein [Terribacillus saccharophilus]